MVGRGADSGSPYKHILLRNVHTQSLGPALILRYGLSDGKGQVECAVMEWIELAEGTDRWDVRLWTGSNWLRIRTGGMCGYGLDRAG